MINVFLIDDHAMLRAGIRQFLEKDDAVCVVGEAGDGLSAQRGIAHAHPLPDVVLLDIKMPKMSGIDVTRWLREAYPDVRVLILTAFDDAPYVAAVLKSGADGYVLKTASPAQLIEAVKTVYGGRPVIDAAVASKVVVGTADVTLTARELDVLRHATNGATNKQIGDALHLSSRTVQTHFANIFRKLDVNTRTEAVTKAMTMGMIAHE